MKIKLFDKEDNKTEFDIEMWDCMKISFFAGLGWTLIWIVFYILLFVLGIIVGYY